MSQEKKTGKVVVSLMKEKLEELRQQAEKEGVTLPTYCRIKLSKMADQE